MNDRKRPWHPLNMVVAASVLGGIALGTFIGAVGRDFLSSQALAQQRTKTGAALPTGVVSPRDVYYPGTEALKPDEMRVVACGTGMPSARPKQAAACFLVELGNGDKFIFDIGTGSAERLSALKIPYDYLDKLFIGHLHSDHFGDLDALWIGGVLSNRQRPLRVWGSQWPNPRIRDEICFRKTPGGLCLGWSVTVRQCQYRRLEIRRHRI